MLKFPQLSKKINMKTAFQTKSRNVTLRRLKILPLLLGLVFATSAGIVNAQAAGDQAGAVLTRAQVKMERDAFLKTHRWDAATEDWVLKSGTEPSTGTKSRAQVKADRDEFLRNHRWDAATDSWVSLEGKPRDLSTRSRAEVRSETQDFLRKYRWDAGTDAWVEKLPAKKK